jgi:AcrR family transcriptional regulator
MVDKQEKKQPVTRRQPQQDRARQKIALILEAATRLIERGDILSLTTNAIAATAGISVGTLYQYFDDKDAILRALIDHEMAGIAARVTEVLQGPAPTLRGGRIPQVMRAVLDSYGGRHRAHRMLMDYALSHGTAGQLNPLYRALIASLSNRDAARPSVMPEVLSEADAFVLTHAIGGVLRGFFASTTDRVPIQDLETSLTRLVLGFVGAPAENLPRTNN